MKITSDQGECIEIAIWRSIVRFRFTKDTQDCTEENLIDPPAILSVGNNYKVYYMESFSEDCLTVECLPYSFPDYNIKIQSWWGSDNKFFDQKR